MVYKYITNIDKKINDTLNIYSEIGRLSIPIVKYLVVVISFLIFTSCFALLYIFYNTNYSSNDSHQCNNINYIDGVFLPIIIYGTICPFISLIITNIFKVFINDFIKRINNKNMYLKKRNINNYKAILDYIFVNKCNGIFVCGELFIYLYGGGLYNIIICGLYFIYVLCRFYNYYEKTVNCNITEIKHCYNNRENYWLYTMNVKIDSMIYKIKKRFSDFKELDNRLDNSLNLETNKWVYDTNNIDNIKLRADDINIYMNKVMNNGSILKKTVFLEFLNENRNYKNEDENNIVMEKENLDNDIEDNELILTNVKNICENLINDTIEDIFILNEINYYNNVKTRLLIITPITIYKLKFYKTYNIFEIREKIEYINIKYINYSTINNSNYFLNNNVMIIQMNNNAKYKFISINNNYNYNINSIKDYFKNNSIKVLETNSYNLDIGYGISEAILNNYYVNSVKDIYYKSYNYIRLK